MSSFVLYFGIMALGYLGGYKMRENQRGKNLASWIMTVCIAVLVLTMGLRMGSNEQVVGNLGSIGLVSLGFTLFLWAGTFLFLAILQRPMGLDRWARTKAMREAGIGITNEGTGNAIPPADGENEISKASERHPSGNQQSAAEEHSGGDDTFMTKLILIMVGIGLLVGYVVILGMLTEGQQSFFDQISSRSMVVELCIMMAALGYGMGLSGEAEQAIRSSGLRILAVPLAIVVATTVTAILAGLVFPQLTVRESLAVGYGYGWYTYAPVCIENAGHEVAAAISFLHNVIREIGGIVLIPFVARYVGYLESASLPGLAVMDIGLPVFLASTRDDMVAYSIAIGLFEGVFVTMAVPLAIG